MRNKNLFKSILFSLCVTAIFFFVMPSASFAAISKSGYIAIAVDALSGSDASDYDVMSAESMLVQELIMMGFKPVDEQKMDQIRRQKAQFFAAVDDVAAIKRLSSQYGVSTIITVHVRASSREDTLVGYDGRVSMAIMATGSDGKRKYAGRIDARKPGRIPEDALSAAMESVVRQAVVEMAR